MNPEELRQIDVLRMIDTEALTRLALALEEKSYREGDTVFGEGDPGDSMYFILRGRVRIEKQARSTTATGKTLAVLEAGDYFGEMALLDQEPRSAAAVAIGPVTLLRLSKSAFDQIQGGSSPAGISILFGMIRTSSERIRRLSSHLIVYDEVGKAIGEAHDLQALLDVILQQLQLALTADWGLLLLRPQFSEKFDLRCCTNLVLTEAQGAAIRNVSGFLEVVLQEPEGTLVLDFDDYEPFKPCQRLGFEGGSLVACPITMENQILGLIVLGGKRVELFDLNGLNLARGVARQAAQAILNARHKEEDQARSRHARQFVRF